MKKKLFIVCASVVMLSSFLLVYAGNQKSKSAILPQFLVENIEVLTQDESKPSCTVSLACSMANAPENTISCTGYRECHRYPVERYIVCDDLTTRCDG